MTDNTVLTEQEEAVLEARRVAMERFNVVDVRTIARRSKIADLRADLAEEITELNDVDLPEMEIAREQVSATFS